MRDYSKVSPKFWTGITGKAIKKMGPEAVIVSLYLMTSPNSNMIGLYYCPMPFIIHESGITAQGASKGLARAIEAGFCDYDEQTEMVWVFEMAKYQIGDRLEVRDKRVKGIQKEYATLPECPFLHGFFEKYKDRYHLKNARGIEGALEGHRSQEQEQEQEQNIKGSYASVGQPEKTDAQPREKIPFAEIVKVLNDKAGTNFKETADATKRLIKARWHEGFRLPDFLTVIESKTQEWGTDAKMLPFIRPQTLFGNKFEGYLQSAVVAEKPRSEKVYVLPDLDELRRRKQAEKQLMGVQ